MCEEHIRNLESKLMESEKERQRYQNEANRIKEMMQRNVISTRHAAQIGKCLPLILDYYLIKYKQVFILTHIFYSFTL